VVPVAVPAVELHAAAGMASAATTAATTHRDARLEIPNRRIGALAVIGMRISLITLTEGSTTAMETSDYLHQIVLHDCQGRVSHTLTLLLEGTVRIDFANGRSAVIDPHTRQNLTPHVVVTDALMDQAAQVRPW
jgi:hypothetical protein